MKKFTTFIFLTLTSFACNKDNNLIADKYVTLSFKQSFCADPWTNNLSNDSLTLKNVAAYLSGNNLYFANLFLKQDTLPDAFNSCNCKTGKTIYVSTLFSDSLVNKFIRLGFK